MSVLAIGLDIVDVTRVARLLERNQERAMERLLSADERRYCQSQAYVEQHVAARIAAKEAAYKALNHEESGYISWQEVEVVRDLRGKPALRLHGRARAAAERLAVSDTLVSLTHTTSHAAAVVVLLGRDARY